MISIILQGPYFKSKEISTCIIARKLKELYPGCEIVFSTWVGQVVEDESIFDHIIYNEDPGISGKDENGKIINADRQIISSLNGIRAAKNQFCLKLRSDCILQKFDILSSLRKFQLNFSKREKNGLLCIFNQKIIVSNVTTKRPIDFDHVCFHISDWVYFGLKEDLLDLLDCKSFKDSSYSLDDSGAISMAPEQHVILSWLKKHKLWKDEYLHSLDIHREVLHNNFIVLSYGQLGLKCYKFGYQLPIGMNGFVSYTAYDYLNDYLNFYKLKRTGNINSFATLLNTFYKNYHRLRFKIIVVLIQLRNTVRSK